MSKFIPKGNAEYYKEGLRIDRVSDPAELRAIARHWHAVWQMGQDTPDSYEVETYAGDGRWESFASGTRDYAIGACDHFAQRDGYNRNRVVIHGYVVYPDEEVDRQLEEEAASGDDNPAA